MSAVQATPSTDSAFGAFSTAPIAKKAQPPPANTATDDAAGSLLLDGAVDWKKADPKAHG